MHKSSTGTRFDIVSRLDKGVYPCPQNVETLNKKYITDKNGVHFQTCIHVPDMF